MAFTLCETPVCAFVCAQLRLEEATTTDKKTRLPLNYYGFLANSIRLNSDSLKGLKCYRPLVHPLE